MNLLDVYQHKPDFTPEQALRLASEFFGVAGKIRSLPSERDQNFRIDHASGPSVLKISASNEDRQVLDFQNEMMQCAAESCSEFQVPQVYRSCHGATIETVEEQTGKTCWVRLLSFLPGVPLHRVNPHSTPLLRSIGRGLGQFDSALFEFDHPSARRELDWDLQRAGTVIDRNLQQVNRGKRLDSFRRFHDRFSTRIAPQLGELRTSVIHNDANDYNVLVREQIGHQQFGGIIDFGDALHSITIAELAIACAYLMLDKRDPLAAAAQVVGGYHEMFPIEAVELAVLFDLILARIHVSLSMSMAREIEQQQRKDLDKVSQTEGDYLFVSARPMMRLLEQLDHVHRDYAQAEFRQACGMQPSPAASRLVGWLTGHAGSFADVTEIDFANQPWHLCDFGVSSPLLSRLDEIPTVDEQADFLFALIRRHGACAGIGRYGEPRIVYQSDQFATSSGVPRTVHLGVDIFLPAGSQVFCPWPGCVHSFQDNSLELDYGPTMIIEHTTDAGTFYTLYGHLSRESLIGLEIGQPISLGQPLATLGDSSENGGWIPHLHFQIITRLFDRRGDFPGVAPADNAALWMEFCPDPNLILGISSLNPVTDKDQFVYEQRVSSTSAALSLSYASPLHIVKGKGQHLYDWHGREYLDCVNNVAHVGHGHPSVVQAIAEQAAVLNTNTRYLSSVFNEYLRALLAKFPESLSVCFLTCSGSEANELAIRLARSFTGGSELVVVDHAYHGNTEQLVGLSPYKFNGPRGKGIGPRTHVVPLPSYCDANESAGADEYSADDYVAGMCEKFFDKLIEIKNGKAKFAGLLVESISGCGGQVTLPRGFLQQAFACVRDHKGLCIADEVQTGFGRVGTHFWAFETHDVIPDIVTMGKPIGNGHPLGAVVTTREIADAFAEGPEYFNTFGGNPVSCAAGLAVLKVIQRDGLQKHAHEVGGYLMARLAELKTSHPVITDIRGAGLFIGIEFEVDTERQPDSIAHYVVERMKQERILLSTDGPLNNVIKIKPPLVFTRTNADQLIDALAKVLSDSCLMSDE